MPRNRSWGGVDFANLHRLIVQTRPIYTFRRCRGMPITETLPPVPKGLIFMQPSIDKFSHRQPVKIRTKYIYFGQCRGMPMAEKLPFPKGRTYIHAAFSFYTLLLARSPSYCKHMHPNSPDLIECRTSSASTSLHRHPSLAAGQWLSRWHDCLLYARHVDTTRLLPTNTLSTKLHRHAARLLADS